MTERWRHALNQGQSIGVIFLDFQKAFDCVSHQLLPSKLQASGICLNALDWILDYLCNRNQYVSINGFNSTTMAIPSGVPQGSLLGPRLFTIFTNDLPSCLESCNSSNMEMFADDSTAFVIGDCVDSIVVQSTRRCNFYMTGHNLTACLFILLKLKLCLFPSPPSLALFHL